jgi:hypothetical protein
VSQNGKKPKVSLASLTDEDAIFKAVRNKCIQSPLTVLPLALAGGILLLTASFGFGFGGVFAAFVLAITGAAAFVYNLWIRGEKLTREHIQSMMQQLKEDRHSALAEVATMCREIGFDEGAKEATELSEAYSKYTTFLESRAGSKLGTAVGERLSLAENARKAGVEHLRQAAEIHVTLSSIHIESLRAELKNWSGQHANPGSRNEILENKIRAHSQQIERYDQLSLRRDHLVARSNELEAALMTAFMSEVGKSDLSLDKSSDNPAKRLSNAVAAAEAAEQDLKGFLDDIQRETSV